MLSASAATLDLVSAECVQHVVDTGQGPLRAGCCWADSAVCGVTFEGMCLYKSGDTRCVAQPRLLVLVPAWSWDDLLSLLSSCAGCRQMELLPNMLIINSLRILALRNISTRAGKEDLRSFTFRNSKPF